MSLLEELQRNPQLKQLAASRLLKWSDLMSSTEETLPDGTKARVIDYKVGRRRRGRGAGAAGGGHTRSDYAIDRKCNIGDKGLESPLSKITRGHLKQTVA